MVGEIQALKGKMNAGNEFFRDKVKGIVSRTTERVDLKSG